MSDLEKVIAQMRQYVHTNDTGHECRVSGHTLTAWANTLDQVSLEMIGAQNAKQQLYDTLFPGEPMELREVRWKWMILQARDLAQKVAATLSESSKVESNG